MVRESWTPVEDGKLRDAVALFGEKNWQSVANALGGRTGPQCSNRWEILRMRDPNIETEGGHGRWSSEEEKRLKVAVTFFGAQNWLKIAQCGAKWKDILDPKVKCAKWTEEEDAKLNEVVKEHGPRKWSNIASHLPGRTGSQCSRKWKSLNPHLAAILQKEARLKREATVGNFVDRESERPDLGTCEFLALANIFLDEPKEPEIVAPEKKRKAREKKSDVAATERQPKRRRRALERCSEDVCRQENETLCENELSTGDDVRLLERHNETGDTVKKTNCPQVKIGPKKLKRRRKDSAVVPIDNQDSPN